MTAATDHEEAPASAETATRPTSASYSLVGVALAAIAAVAFSLRAIFVKLAYEDMSDPVTLLALRMIFSLPFLAVAAVIHRRSAPARTSLTAPLTRRDALALTALGFVGYYLSSFLDMAGLQFVGAGIGRLLIFLYPTIVVIISALVLDKRISQREVVALLITYAGVALVLSAQFNRPSENFWLGAGLVMSSAITFSIYLVGSGEVVTRLGPIRFTAYATAAASVFCIMQFLLLRPLSALALPLRVYELALAMALFSTVMPLFMMAEALRRIGASRVAMVSALGPAATVVSGYLGLDERMTWLQTIGGVLIVSGVLIVAAHVRRMDRKQR
ncbi:EamA family transporter [Bradyrhizobium manausense]|uniref:DMT family transporter n=1 Tax=Bradyrhizobium TaxID=374 RepID=UPI001BA707D1|nr:MULTISPECIES: DMT family transporter [Bradyrhizobium]MBR0824372.1 EamA family transporter [Bradyrhizobium manausense]UVO26767.1 DMT family transporter [Bradyrhizobium arachidis]